MNNLPLRRTHEQKSVPDPNKTEHKGIKKQTKSQRRDFPIKPLSVYICCFVKMRERKFKKMDLKEKKQPPNREIISKHLSTR